MIKKYGYICFLLIASFFLHVDWVDAAIDSCVCYANGNNSIGLTSFTLTYDSSSEEVGSDIIGSTFHSPVLGDRIIYEIENNFSGLAHASGRGYIKRAMKNGNCPETVYVDLFAEHITNRNSGVGDDYVFEYSCMIPASEEMDYRNGDVFDELYDKLISSKNSYENCLKTSCSDLSNLKQQFEDALMNMEAYRIKLYSDIHIHESVYSELFEQVEAYRVEYESWIQQGLIDDYTASCGLISKDLEVKLIWILNIIKYGGVVLAIGLGMLDFFKAILSDENDATKKAIQKFIKRLIAAVCIFLLPLIIQFLITTVNIQGVDSSNPFCIELR